MYPSESPCSQSAVFTTFVVANSTRCGYFESNNDAVVVAMGNEALAGYPRLAEACMALQNDTGGPSHCK